VGGVSKKQNDGRPEARDLARGKGGGGGLFQTDTGVAEEREGRKIYGAIRSKTEISPRFPN